MSDGKNRKISKHSIHGKIDISALTTLLLFLPRCLGPARPCLMIFFTMTLTKESSQDLGFRRIHPVR